MAFVPLPGVLASLKMNQQIRQNHHSILRSQSRNGDETWRNRFRPWLLAACGQISRARLSYHSLLNWLIAASSCSSSTSSQGANTEFFQLGTHHPTYPASVAKTNLNNHSTRPRLWLLLWRQSTFAYFRDKWKEFTYISFQKWKCSLIGI